MPPKRAAAAAAGSQPKKSRPSNGADADTPEIPRDPRWAAVSGSANLDMEYKGFIQKPAEAYKYVLMCQAPFEGCGKKKDDDDEEEDEEDEDEEDEDEGNCDGGKTCLCNKLPEDHPEHVFKLTAAAKRKWFGLRTHCDLRDPDGFQMYTFNDHLGYGTLEVLQNVLLDFEQAAGNYKEQWAICEALAFFMPTGHMEPFRHIDDGDTVDATFQLIGRLFLSMLAQLERENLLSKDSEIQNLGLIMALFMMTASDLPDYGILESSEKESIGPKKDKKSWSPHSFTDQIVAYARKYDIQLVGPSNISELIEAADSDADLPDPASNTGKADPFDFAKALKSYKNARGGICQFLSKRKKAGKTPIGGDALDITTWTSKERAEFAYNGKDPLKKKELDAIKDGAILGMA